jgi:hypothetical protein
VLVLVLALPLQKFPAGDYVYGMNDCSGLSLYCKQVTGGQGCLLLAPGLGMPSACTLCATTPVGRPSSGHHSGAGLAAATACCPPAGPEPGGRRPCRVVRLWGDPHCARGGLPGHVSRGCMCARSLPTTDGGAAASAAAAAHAVGKAGPRCWSVRLPGAALHLRCHHTAGCRPCEVTGFHIKPFGFFTGGRAGG